MLKKTLPIRPVVGFLKQISFIFFGLLLLCGVSLGESIPRYQINEKLLERDFLRITTASEYGGFSKFARSIKKYTKTVRYKIVNHAAKHRHDAVSGFMNLVDRQIDGLSIERASSLTDANFVIHIVDKAQYADVIKNEVYRRPDAKVRGRCFVRVLPGEAGIGKTDVVILSDHSEKLFQRCLVEEVLQGLGPLADKANRKYSVFNTYSEHSTFTLHDRLLMKVLYDPRIKAGMSKAEVKLVLPAVIRDTVAKTVRN